MYEIVFYRTDNGKDLIKEYLDSLNNKNKDNRIKLNKIYEYFLMLEKNGTRAGIPYIKHIEDNIWELRPLRDRFFFAHYIDNKFVILHHFVKKTQKTPNKEIEQAKRNYNNLMKRGG